MIARAGTWAEVGLGTYVRDPQGTVYRVQGLFPEGSTAEVTMTSQAGVDTAAWVALSDPVTIMEPTHDEAIAVAHRGLGATILREER